MSRNDIISIGSILNYHVTYYLQAAQQQTTRRQVPGATDF